MHTHRIHRIVLSLVAVAACAGPLAGVAQAAAPINSGLPQLTPMGTQPQGTLLTLLPGTWDASATSTVDTWQQCDGSGASCVSITTATGNSYTIPADSTNLGMEIQVSETATNSADSTTTTVTSNAITVVLPPAPSNTVAPVISGTPALEGKPLTASQGTWSNTPKTFAYEWDDCSGSPLTCTPSPTSANSSTYTVTAADANAQIEVKVTATNDAGSTTTPSNPTAAATGLPVNTGAPVISGTPALQGKPLTASQGTWSNTPKTFAYEWDDCSGSPLTCTPSPTSANSSTYTVTAADANAQIEVKVTATNDAGSTTAPSGPTAAATGLPVGSGQPTITGTTWQGQTLTDSTHATWTNSPTGYTYQWQRCDGNGANCSNIGGATNQTYTLVAADVGKTIVVQETASNASGPGAAAASAASSVITLPPPGVVAAPSISGTAQQAMTLTEGAAHWSNSPTSIMITWYRCDSNGATCKATGSGATYLLTADDLGALIQVSETASNASNVPVIAVSPYAGPVATPAGHVDPPTPKAGSQPAISGVAQLGRTLTASRADFNGNPGNFNYQWLRCNALGCSTIPGETDLTYTPTSADVGDSIAFSEIASNSGGASAPAQSARTDTITAPSTTSLQTNAAAPFAGQTVTLIATVTSAAGSVTPAGTVDFHSNGAAIPGCTGLTLGTVAPTAVCQTSFPASVANVTAAYSAAAGTFITGSTSSATTLTVARASTTVTVAASAHVSLGNTTTYTAVLHPPASSLTPTGRVTFTDGGKTIKGCGSTVLSADRAPCSVKYLGLKQHRIAVRYSGDANFAPSGSLTSHVVVQPQAPKGFVAVFMNWSFKFNLHATRIALLSATGLSAGIHITVSCSGGGCPFAHRAMTVIARGKCGKTAKKGCVAAPSFNLASIFHRARLHIGTKVAVAVTHRGWVGKYYRFTIRKGRKPVIDVSCLAVNGTRPGVGCSAR